MPDVRIIEIDKKIQEANDLIARRIHDKLKQFNIQMIDIMGSVGSGKTSILEYFVKNYGQYQKILVINGDLATDIDAQRIARYGGTCLQINTGKGCHLMAFQIEKALEKVDLKEYGIIFVENVGNLICPSATNVGADFKVSVTSVTEGPYVFQKHPITFKLSQASVINKIDLADAMDINVRNMKDNALKLYPHLKIFLTSTKTGEGMDSLAKYFTLKME
ncbi:MAG: hydrogenase nickel incorporation protein HypB [Candidatus Hodarchaeales archaeon]